MSDFLKGVSSCFHLPSQLGPADRSASVFFVVGQTHSWFWVSGHEDRPIRPNSCSAVLCPVRKVAFWPKLFTIHRFRRLIWHSVASQVAQQSAETVLGWCGGHANKVDIWSNLRLFFSTWRKNIFHKHFCKSSLFEHKLVSVNVLRHTCSSFTCSDFLRGR